MRLNDQLFIILLTVLDSNEAESVFIITVKGMAVANVGSTLTYFSNFKKSPVYIRLKFL